MKQQLVENLLGENLHAWLRQRLDAGARWKDVTAAIHDRTRIEVTEVSLRAWYPDLRRRGDDTEAS